MFGHIPLFSTNSYEMMGRAVPKIFSFLKYIEQIPLVFCGHQWPQESEFPRALRSLFSLAVGGGDPYS